MEMQYHLTIDRLTKRVAILPKEQFIFLADEKAANQLIEDLKLAKDVLKSIQLKEVSIIKTRRYTIKIDNLYRFAKFDIILTAKVEEAIFFHTEDEINLLINDIILLRQGLKVVVITEPELFSIQFPTPLNLN